MAEVERIIRESEVAVEIVQCGNYRMTNGIMKLISELGMEHRVIFGNDAPSGTGVIPLGSSEISAMCPVYAGLRPIKRLPWQPETRLRYSD